MPPSTKFGYNQDGTRKGLTKPSLENHLKEKGEWIMSICEGCILFGRCDGNCGDTNPNYYEEQEENDRYDSEYYDSEYYEE